MRKGSACSNRCSRRRQMLLMSQTASLMRFLSLILLSIHEVQCLKYSALAITHSFVPLAFEMLGAWGVEAAAFVAELGRRMTAVTGDPRETVFIRQRLSVAIQRGNAIACRGTRCQGWLMHQTDFDFYYLNL